MAMPPRYFPKKISFIMSSEAISEFEFLKNYSLFTGIC